MRKNKETVLSSAGIHYLNFSNLQKDGLLHGFTLRPAGLPSYDSLNLGLHVGDRMCTGTAGCWLKPGLCAVGNYFRMPGSRHRYTEVGAGQRALGPCNHGRRAAGNRWLAYG